MKEILDVIHKTIYQFFDVCGDDEEVPISDKDKLLLEVNKAICNNLKALEQDSCENAISREAVLSIFDEWFSTCNIADKRESPKAKINALPLVTPKPRTGKWVKTPKAVMGEGYLWYCDKCEHQVYQDSSRSYPSEKYCPNCGDKKMEGESNGTTD